MQLLESLLEYSLYETAGTPMAEILTLMLVQMDHLKQYLFIKKNETLKTLDFKTEIKSSKAWTILLFKLL